MKRVAILQSNYIPWKGYFDLIGAVDEFVFYDDAQYTRRDWRNRNRIKTPQGVQWLSVPVHASTALRVRDIELSDPGWAAEHWRTLTMNYARARFYGQVAQWLEPLYRGAAWRTLSEANTALVGAVCRALGIATRLSDSAAYRVEGDRNAKLVSIACQAGATRYVSGPAARAYLDEAAFSDAGIAVDWFSYAGYPEYPQLWGGPFLHDVSILDLLFNCGPDAAAHLVKRAVAP